MREKFEEFRDIVVSLVERIRDLARSKFDQMRRMQDKIPFPVVMGILIVAFLLEVAVVGLLISIGILPIYFLLLVIFVILAIDVGLFVLLTNRKMMKEKFYTGLILTTVLMILFLPVSYYMYSTSDALKRISSMRDQWEEYDVIALKDGSYKELDDIKGKEIFGIDNNSKMNTEARERLVTTADVEFKDKKDFMALAACLQDGKGQKHDNVIFTSKSYYDIQCEEIEGFEKNTKVIYSVDVQKRALDRSRRVNVVKDSFNIYITGLDTWGSIDKVSRSDVNMIVTVNPQTREILLTSIPRDAYVKLHTPGEMDKLTHSGIYGVDETLDTVSDWLDIELDYYVKVNFSMLVRLVDAIGGIKVYSDQAFDSAVSDYSYKKGWNKMGGKRALYFARERKAFKNGDAQRVKNQQRVVKALIKKVTSNKVILMNYTEILDAFADNMVTNLSTKEMSALARMQLRDMDKKWTVKSINIKCKEASRGTYSMGMNRELYVNIPEQESVDNAKKQIHDVMYPVETSKDTNLLFP